MKTPKIATMSLDAMYAMRNSLEKAISSQLKAARKGIAALPMMGATKPKRKTKKTTARKSTARGAAKRKTATRAKPVRRAAAKRRSVTRVSRKRG